MSKTIELIKELCYLRSINSKHIKYQTKSGHLFKIPLEDIGDTVFNSIEDGVFLARWIRESLSEAEYNSNVFTSEEFRADPSAAIQVAMDVGEAVVANTSGGGTIRFSTQKTSIDDED